MLACDSSPCGGSAVDVIIILAPAIDLCAPFERSGAGKCRGERNGEIQHPRFSRAQGKVGAGDHAAGDLTEAGEILDRESGWHGQKNRHKHGIFGPGIRNNCGQGQGITDAHRLWSGKVKLEIYSLSVGPSGWVVAGNAGRERRTRVVATKYVG